jgi:glycosyltransferase involved in cell wall biosynthesis
VRVLIVSSYFPPHVGGVEVVAERQAQQLAGAGHDVVVATSRPDRGHAPDERRDGYRVLRLPVRNGIEERFGIPYPLVGPAFVGALRRLVRWSEVVHVHDVLYQPSQTAALLADRLRRPLFATQHVGPVNHPHPLVRRVEHLVGTVAGRYVWSRAQRVVAYNPMVAAHLTARGVPRERVVHSSIGVDTDRFRPGPAEAGLRAELGLPTDTPLVLFVGRLVDKKGYRHAVQAVGPGHHVVLVGSGRPAVSAPPGATFLGPLPQDRLLTLYRSATVLLLPSTGEVFPLVAQEAMACGLPVVLTDAPGYAAYRPDRRLLRLVPPEPTLLRREVEAVVADPVLRTEMAGYVRQFALTHFAAGRGDHTHVTLYDPSTRGEPCTSPSWS